MLEPTPTILDLAWRLLAHEMGDGSDPAQLAGAAEEVCRKLKETLSPIVGEEGFRAVLAQALKRTRGEFGSLAPIDAAVHESVYLKGLREWTQGRDLTEVSEALTTLFANFLALLISLIGRDLSHRFLGTAWPDVQIGIGP